MSQYCSTHQDIHALAENMYNRKKSFLKETSEKRKNS